MKKITITLCLTLATCFSLFAQSVLPGPKGIWIIPGYDLSQGHEYHILRKTSGSEWQPVATLRKPASIAEIRARIISVGKISGNGKELSQRELDYAWKHIQRRQPDSLAWFATNFQALYGFGLAYYDDSATALTQYSYKVVSVQNERKIAEKIMDGVQFPGKPPVVTFELKNTTITKSGIVLEYRFSNTQHLAGVNVWRGYYQRTSPEKITPSLLFSRAGDQWKLVVSDHTVSPRAGYSYIIQPVDAAGNEGTFTGLANVHNVQKNTISPSVSHLQTRSIESQKCIQLSWKLGNYADVISIELFRSKEYDGSYMRIASLSPSDTSFNDVYVKPIETYYYSVVLNGMYETSIQSARVSGMLKASEKNVTTARNFALSQKGNVVLLSWEKADPHTHGYFLYRSDGPDRAFRHIRTVVTDSAKIQLADTLPMTAETKIYEYAVRPQNTSYALGPFSSKLKATSYGFNRLGMPIRLETIRHGANRVRLIWQNQEETVASAFIIYRKEVDTDGKDLTSFSEVGRSVVNQWTDSSLAVGKRYMYGVRNRGTDDNDLSAMSPLAMVYAEQDAVAGVANIQAMITGENIQVNWNNPVGIPLRNIEIFRAEEGGKPFRLSQLTPEKESFVDNTVKAGKTYYYFVKTIDSNGFESKLEGPAGIVAQ